MEVATFCAESRVVVVAGKGGVGKTTVAATLAKMGANAGLSVLIVELEGKSGITTIFGIDGPLGYDETVLVDGGPGAPGSVRARQITPDDALLEYLADHGLRRVSKRLMKSGVIDVVATAIPGIQDVLVLGKVKQLEQNRVADLIVVDAPATGHAVTFLTSASGLLDAARGGPVRAQAADVVELLSDPARCRVVLVTLPEEMPVSETVEAAYQLEDKANIQLGPVVVNAYEDTPLGLDEGARAAAEAAGVVLSFDQLEALDGARLFRLERNALQAAQIERLGRELPLPQLRTPLLGAAALGPVELETLAAALATGVAGLSAEVAPR
jgi:anion-transporting  ArsA/GET3 family ATPase